MVETNTLGTDGKMVIISYSSVTDFAYLEWISLG